MMRIEQSGRTVTKILLFVLIGIGIIGYSLYQARNLILGPELAITAPLNGATVENALVHITGTAKNVSYISLNNRQIFVDNKGTFNEDLLLAPGYNVWELQAKDKFGRVVSKKLELVLNKNS
jgi:hypothetical protein